MKFPTRWLRPGHEGPSSNGIPGVQISTPEPAPLAVRPKRFLDDAEIQTLPDPEWIIAGILPANALAQCYGAPGSFKTFLMIDWSFRIATGTAWGGNEVRAGPVVYVFGEGHSGIKLRVAAWKHQHEFDPESRAGCGVFFLAEPVQLMHPDEVAAFTHDIGGELETPPVLIVFDTQARCTVGAEENSAKDMGQVIQNLDRIREETGATVAVIHHSGWDGDHGRGSSALAGASDTILKAKRNKGSDQLTLSCEKQKDAEEFEPLELVAEEVLESLTLRIVGTSSPTSTERALSENERRALQALAGEEDGRTHGEWKTETRLPNSTFGRVRIRLVSDGYVERIDGRYVLTERGQDALPPTTKSLPRDSHGTGPDQSQESHPPKGVGPRDSELEARQRKEAEDEDS